MSDSAPDVAAANVGKTFVDVVVSFVIVAPEPDASAHLMPDACAESAVKT
jgi:hypothetical protein